MNDEKRCICAANIKMNNGSYFFDVIIKDECCDWMEVTDVVLNMGGMHNIENMVAAIAVAHELKIEDEKIKAAVSSFKGVKRRFEYIVKNEKVLHR
jgi:UDP-N-acetylmuramate--alanine ligase